MDFDEVISCLETPERREEFIARLKNAGKHSSPFSKLQSSMVELKMHKAPRGIFEKTTLQHAFKFCHADECFQKFRLVCKQWKNTVETIRFNQKVGFKVFNKLDSYITLNGVIPKNYFSKYLPLFKKMFISLNRRNKTQIFSLILQNTKKLNEIKFGPMRNTDDESQTFVFQILQKLHDTIQIVTGLRTLRIPDIHFPNLTHLYLWVGGANILLDEFQTYFPKALKNMENLEVVKVSLTGSNWQSTTEYIGEHYAKHCISSSVMKTLNFFQTPMANIGTLSELENKKLTPSLQYLSTDKCVPDKPMENDWDRYREIFDQCINLKAIDVLKLNENFETEILPTLSETNQEIWKERLSYFKARGIHIVDDDKIFDNEDLQNQLAKEAGITWRFQFW